ncbi:MAG: hypothetical protein QOE03_2284, partial [Micromonosporaceae bacterium]|nr:hypothetical protein [Micromonosporaceae bacterium]
GSCAGAGNAGLSGVAHTSPGPGAPRALAPGALVTRALSIYLDNLAAESDW